MNATRRLVTSLAAILLLVSCAATGEQLLDEDYRRMSDSKLKAYYLELDEAIETCKSEVKTDDPAFEMADGAAMNQEDESPGSLPSDCDAVPLIERRTDVLEEMGERGVKPPRQKEDLY